MSLQLVCINYGSFQDALKVVKHSMRIFPRFSKATIIHPNPVMEASDLTEDLPWIEVFVATSKTQNECCLFEMPQYITCDHAIGIQWDGFIVNPEAWTDEFLEYDLVAPPWPLQNIVNPEWRVGSGGFVLFSKKMCQMWGELCQPHPYPNDWSMGAVDRQKFEDRGIKFAPLELAMRFGKELDLEDREFPEGQSFGFHSFRTNVEYRKKYYNMVYGK